MKAQFIRKKIQTHINLINPITQFTNLTTKEEETHDQIKAFLR